MGRFDDRAAIVTGGALGIGGGCFPQAQDLPIFT